MKLAALLVVTLAACIEPVDQAGGPSGGPCPGFPIDSECTGHGTQSPPYLGGDFQLALAGTGSWTHDGDLSTIVVDPSVIALFGASSGDDLTVMALRPGTFQAEVDQQAYEPLLVPFTISPVAAVELLPCSYQLRGGPVAWAPGSTVCVAITGQDHQALTDHSLTYSRGSDGARGHEVDNNTDRHGLELTAGSFGTRSFDFDVVAEAERIEVDPDLCFHAFAGEREVIAKWTFVVDTGSSDTTRDNCFWVSGPGPHTVTGTALGLSESIELD